MFSRTRVVLLSICLVFFATAAVFALRGKQPVPVPRASLLDAYGRLPLAFEANRGQSRPEVKFLSRNAGHTLFLTGNGAQLQLQGATLTLQFPGANPRPAIEGAGVLPGHTNYFLGQDPKQWRTQVPNYARVEVDELYPGIDLVWHGNQRRLEHDFIVAPGADPRIIRMTLEGASSLKLDAQGALVAATAAGEVRFGKPDAWQERNGRREAVACEYILGRDGEVRYLPGEYDPTRELVIDPVLLYSSFLGGSGFEQAFGVGLDKDGNIFLAGAAFNSDFPGASPIQAAPGGDNDVFVVKLNPTASAVLYGTWIGGTLQDTPGTLAVDPDGNAYVAGFTFSANFPVTSGALQKQRNGIGGDGFVAKLNAAGTALIYATYLGGNGGDFIDELVVDAGGNAFVAGLSDSSDLLANGYQAKRASSGLYKTADRAAAWAGSGANLPLTSVQAIAVDPGNSNTIYAGGLAGLYKSTDGGAQWNATGQATGSEQAASVLVISIDPVNRNTLYAGSQFGGILKSTNGGDSFTGISVDPVNVFATYDILIDPAAPNTLYAGTNAGAFKSLDGGATWSLLANLNSGPTPGQRPRVNRLLLDPANRQIVYAGTNRGVFKSTDGGANWTSISNGLGQGPLFIEIASLAIDSSAPNTLYASTSGFNGALFKTTDGGATWRTSNTGLFPAGGNIPASVTALVIDPAAPATLYAATSLGVYKTTDGAATWAAANSGIPAQTITALAIDARTPANLFAGINSGSDAFVAKLNPQGAALVWLTYLGGALNDDARGIALDRDGNVLVAGQTSSANFPTAAPLQAANAGVNDAYIAKLNPAGTSLLYSTYFGGSAIDAARGLKLNAAGEIYIVGTTSSPNLPLKNAALTAPGGGSDAFVAKLNAAGSAIEYSTYLGGLRNENGAAIALEGTGSAYVTGDTASTNFPLLDSTQAQFGGGTTDVFAAKLSPAGAPLMYSTYIGGSGDERGNAIVVDSRGSAFVAGETRSANFPRVTPLSGTLRGSGDAFLLKLGVEADLAVAKTVSRNPVQVNNAFSFTVTAVNNGPSSATGVRVTDVLPPSLTFGSATASKGSCANASNTVTCNLGNLAVGETVAITVNVTPTAAGQVGSTASIQGNETDSTPANNQATAQVTISTLPSIYGRVTQGTNPLAGITLNLSGGQTATQQSSAQGGYQFANLPAGGNYTVTPVSGNFSFEPPSRTFNPLNADAPGDFTATPCTYTLSPANQTFEAAGGAGMIAVTAPPRCAWTAASNAAWIKITAGASASGNGSVSFTVDPAASPRGGRITIGGQAFLVWQGINACSALRFREKSYFEYGFPNELFSEDLDNDGLSDLIVPQATAESDPAQGRFAFPLTIYYGEANGQLSRGPRLLLATVTQTRALAAGDFNGDNRTDLVVSPTNEPEVRLLLGNGARGFTIGGSVRLTPQNTSDFPGTLHAADLNKDGKLDLIANSSSKVLIALNTSTGSNIAFGAPFSVSYEGQSFRGLFDVNKDGVVDLITQGGGFVDPAVFAVYLGDGLGSFRQPITSPGVTTPQPFDVADFNADGNPDFAMLVFLSTPQGQRFQVGLSYGDGTGRFASPVIYDPLQIAQTSEPAGVIARDANNDGRPDILVLGDRKARAVLTDGAGRPGSTVELATVAERGAGRFVAGNFDGGNRVDFATIDTARNSVVVYWNRCNTSGLSISGQVLDRTTPEGFAGVTVRLTGAQTATATTDIGGNYEFTGLAPGNYTVAVERGGLDFNPASQALNNLTTDQIVNFSGTRRGTTVSSASFLGQALAPNSIASIFGVDMTRRIEIATQQPLPILLANMYVNVKDSAGVERTSELFFVSPGQINFLIRPETAPGPATLRVYSPTNPNEPETNGTLQIERVAPGLFTANANGAGVAAAVALRVRADGSQSFEPVVRLEGTRFVSTPIDLGPASDQVFLLLFGTGIRNNGGLSTVSARIGGEASEVLYASLVEGLAGLDQINLRLPRSLVGRGEVDLLLTVEGKPANTVRINVK